MAYIGREPTVGNFQVCDAISVVNNQAAYTMQVGGVNVVPETANHMLVSLNGILQAPGSSYTVSGSTITFASNLVTGDVIDFIQILGSVLDLGVPSDNTVTTAKIADSSVSLAKLTATGTKDATTFLRGDNSFAEVPAGGITMVDNWRVTTAFSGNATPISSNWERNDTAPCLSYLGSQMTESSGIFSFPSTGIYLITHEQNYKYTGNSQYISAYIKATTDNSTYVSITETNTNLNTASGNHYTSNTSTALVDITDTSNQKVRFDTDKQNTSVENSASSARDTLSARFIRLSDT
jgi:hypothetical protein